MGIWQAVLERLGARPKLEKMPQACGCVFDGISGTWLEHNPQCRRVHKNRDTRIVHPPSLAAKWSKIRGGNA